MELMIDRLSKRYGQHVALRELSLRLSPGMLGLVGPNGAGKTSLMRMIATLLSPTEGTIRWNGQDIRTHGQALRQVLGYLPQDFGVYPEFTGRQFLRYLAAMKGLPKSLVHRRVDEVLSTVNLEQEADRKLPTYSGGMKQTSCSGLTGRTSRREQSVSPFFSFPGFGGETGCPLRDG